MVVEVKSEPSNFHKYWGSYETSNHSKAHYINTHPHLMKVSSHYSKNWNSNIPEKKLT